MVFGIREAPTFRPTAAEFEDPLAYIASIRSEGERFGICRIVPPPEWKNNFAIDLSKLRFSTRVQKIHELQHKPGRPTESGGDFRTRLAAFWSRNKKKGHSGVQKWPTYYEKEVDLGVFYAEVKRRGGYHAVMKQKLWREIADTMRIKQMGTVGISYVMRTAYEKCLLEYENYQNEAVGDDEDTGDVVKTDALEPAETEEPKNATISRVQLEIEPRKPPSDSMDGYDVDPAAESAKVMIAAAMEVDGPGAHQSEEDVKDEKPGMVQNELESLADGLLTMQTAKAEADESTDSDTEEEEDETGDYEPPCKRTRGERSNTEVRRSTRARQPTRTRQFNALDSKFCEQCGGGSHEDKMLLCDKCNSGYHMFCIVPEISRVPEGQWLCTECLSEDAEYGFDEGDDYHYSEFERMAFDFEREFCEATWKDSNGNPRYPADVGIDEREEEYWRIVEDRKKNVSVCYAADLATSDVGSGFPKDDNGRFSGWNLNNIPTVGESLLKYAEEDIPGIVVPWLYIGMMYSSFCWHIEDHYFPSINYHHFGAPKVWYGVPSADGAKFESVFKRKLPQMFRKQPDLLFQLVSMLSPRHAVESNIPVCRAVQEEGNFIITFPGGYHGGFNAGLNCAEAVNFAPPDWLRYGMRAVERYRNHLRRPPLSHEELLLAAAKQTNPYDLHTEVESRRWLGLAISRLIRSECINRYSLFNAGMRASRRMPVGLGLSEESEEEALCSICQSSLFVSGCECECSPGRAVCFKHAKQLCECGVEKQRLLYRYSLKELEELFDPSGTADMSRPYDFPPPLCPTCPSESAKRPSTLHEFELVSGGDDSFISQEMADAVLKAQSDLAWAWADGARELQDLDHIFASRSAIEIRNTNGGMFRYAAKNTSESPNGSKAEFVELSNERLLELYAGCQSFIWASQRAFRLEELSGGDKRKELALSLWKADLVAEAIGFSNRLSHALSSTVSMEEASKLLRDSQALNIKVIDGEESRLRRKQEIARDLSERTRQALDLKAYELKALKSLAHEILFNGLTFDEFENLKREIKRASVWEDKVRRFLPKSRKLSKFQRPTIGEFESLAEEGEAIGCILPKMNEVSDTIAEAYEWRGRVLDALANKGATLGDLELLSYQGDDISCQMPELEALDQRVMIGHAWLEEYRSKEGELDMIPMSELEDLINRGDALPMAIPEALALISKVKVRLWRLEKREMLKTKTTPQRVVELLNKGRSLPEPPIAEIENLESKLQEYHDWHARAGIAKCKGAELTMAELSKIVADGSRLRFHVENFSELKERLQRAQEWTSKAQSILRRNPSSRRGTVEPVSMQFVEKLINEFPSLEVTLPEIEGLRNALRDAGKWSDTAKDALAASLNSELGGQAGRDALLHKLRNVLFQGETFGFQSGTMGALVSRIDSLEWEKTADELLLSTSSSLPKLQDHLQRLSSERLNVDKFINQRLAEIVALGENWEKRMLQLLEAKPDIAGIGSNGKRDIQEIETLAEEARKVPIIIPCLADVDRLAQRYRKWEKEVRDVLGHRSDAASKKKPLKTFQRLLDDYEAGVITSDISSELGAVVDKAKQWMERLRKALMKRGSHDKLENVLATMVQNASRAVEVRSSLNDEEKGVFCMCQSTTAENNSLMIHCDKCGDWYHLKCVGLSRAEEKKMTTYKCSLCLAVEGDVLPLATQQQKRKFKSAQPDYEVLDSLNQEAESLPCHIDEAAAIKEILGHISTFRMRCSHAVEQFKRQEAPDYERGERPPHPDAPLLPYETGEILSCVKSCLAHEASLPDELKLMLMGSVLGGPWEIRISHLLQQDQKPTTAFLHEMKRAATTLGLGQILLLEAEAEAEKAITRLGRMIVETEDWFAKVSDITKAPLKYSIEEIKDVIAQAADLPATIETHHLDSLAEYTIPYCVCRQRYDPDRPMVCCDECEGWFHYDCVGKPVPVGDEEVMESFVCPACQKANEPLIDDSPAIEDQAARVPSPTSGGGISTQPPPVNVQTVESFDVELLLPSI